MFLSMTPFSRKVSTDQCFWQNGTNKAATYGAKNFLPESTDFSYVQMVDCCRSRRILDVKEERSIGIVSSRAVVVITATAKNMDQVDLAKTHLYGRLWQDASPVNLPYMQWSQWNLCGGQKSFARCIRGSHCCAASVFVSSAEALKTLVLSTEVAFRRDFFTNCIQLV